LITRTKSKPFRMYIIDHDNKIFNIIGPMKRDSSFNKWVVLLRKEGRDVSCCSIHSKSPILALVRKYKKQSGFAFEKYFYF